MGKFWFLLTVAFIDLAVAAVLAGWGHGPVAFLFLLMAAILGVYAFVSVPSTIRDARGRLQPAEPPFGKVLGTVGALVILASAAYVAVVSTRPAAPVPDPVAAKRAQPSAAAPPPVHAPPRSFSTRASGAALYKCVDAQGHASYQSRPCPAGSEQAWVRDATPDPEPTPAQRRLLARQRAAQARTVAPGSGYIQAPDRRAGIASSGPSAACLAAREADAAYRRLPLRQVTHDGLRWHGDRVREACR